MIKIATKTNDKNAVKGITKKRRSNPSSGLKGFSTAMRFLATFTDYERFTRIGYNDSNFNLNRMQKLLSAVGNPHRKFKSVHIAGTKGKGSTAYMLATMLMGSGYKVGLYTSPHLVDLRERIMIDSEMISAAGVRPHPEQACTGPSRVQREEPPDVLRSPDRHGLHVLRRAGSGHRRHRDRPGRPARQHQRDQARSLRASPASARTTCTSWATPWPRSPRRRPASSRPASRSSASRRTPEVKDVLSKVAKTVKAPLKFTGKDIEFSYRFESSRLTGPHTRICLTTARSKFEHLPVPLLGEHQAINCGLALAMLDPLKEQGFQIDDQQAIEGLARTKLPGRMEMIREDPRILVDGAHNPPASRP